MGKSGMPQIISRRSLLHVAPLPVAFSAVAQVGRPVRLAIIGFDGHPGEITGPLPKLPEVEVAAIADPDPKVLERAARNTRLEKANRYADYEQMLGREKIDVLAVCNNNGERGRAVLAGVKRKLHVIAEKPLTLKMDELNAIKRGVAETGVKLGMLLPMRYSPSYAALRRIVQSGEIGDVVQMSAQKSYKSGERPAWMKNRATYGGTIPWIGPHMIDLMRYCSGREFTEAISFQTQIPQPGVGEMENVTLSMFRLDNGGLAELRMDYFRPAAAPTHGDDRLRLVGTKGIAEYIDATGVTVMTDTAPPRKVTDLPERKQVFVEFLDYVYGGKPASLPHDDIFRVTEITIVAHNASSGRAMKI
jgi:predicted dehydrogenase